MIKVIPLNNGARQRRPAGRRFLMSGMTVCAAFLTYADIGGRSLSGRTSLYTLAVGPRQLIECSVRYPLARVHAAP
jgi:hypothetical protein